MLPRLVRMGLALALVATLLSGCLAQDEGVAGGSSESALDSGSATQERSQQIVAQAEAGAPAQARPVTAGDAHGEVQRTTTDVAVAQDAQGIWHAVQTTTLKNGVGAFRAAAVDQDLFNGDVRLGAAPVGSYLITATLDAQGLTEQMARDNLARLDLVHSDTVDGERLALDTFVDEKPFLEVPTPLGGTISVGSPTTWTGSFATVLPAHVAYDLQASVYSGELQATGIAGDSIVLSSYSGSVQAAQLVARDLAVDTYSGSVGLVKSTAAHLAVDTYSGDADIEGVFDDVAADTYSGNVHAKLAPAASGAYAFEAYSGNIDVALGMADGQAYDIVADAYSGDVDVDVKGTQAVADDDADAHVRSPGFERAAIAVQAGFDAYSGNIHVTG